MPTITQQTYIRIPIADLDNITDSEKAEIKKAAKAGIIFDVLLVFNDAELRPIAYDFSNETITLFSPSDDDIITIEV